MMKLWCNYEVIYDVIYEVIIIKPRALIEPF